MTTILKLDAQQKYQFDRNQISRDITKLVTEWARQNYQFAIEKGIAFEQFHADFTVKYCTAFVDIYKNLIMAAIERFKADISKFVEPIKGLVEAAKLPFEVASKNAEIEKWNTEFKTSDNAREIDEALKIFDLNTKKVLSNFSTQVTALDSIAKQQAALIQASSRSVLGVKKLT